MGWGGILAPTFKNVPAPLSGRLTLYLYIECTQGAVPIHAFLPLNSILQLHNDVRVNRWRFV